MSTNSLANKQKQFKLFLRFIKSQEHIIYTGVEKSLDMNDECYIGNYIHSVLWGCSDRAMDDWIKICSYYALRYLGLYPRLMKKFAKLFNVDKYEAPIMEFVINGVYCGIDKIVNINRDVIQLHGDSVVDCVTRARYELNDIVHDYC